MNPKPALTLALASAAHLAVMSSNAAAASFADDLAFLSKHVEVLLLSDKKGVAQVAVVPGYQGRVMTSTATGPAGTSFGWINRELIGSRKLQPHINAFGGEERFWLGPEGGQFSVFFKKGDAFDLAHWQTPPVIDTERYEVSKQTLSSVEFKHQARLANYSATEFNVEIHRKLRLLDAGQSSELLGAAAGPKTKLVAYESSNSIKNTGAKAWTKDTGLLSIWMLGMFNPGPKTTVVIPYRAGAESKLGPVVNDAYFGKVPPDRLAVKPKAIFFKGDGQQRGKIGLSPKRAKPLVGSYDASEGVLTLVQFSLPKGAKDYVNSMWEIQKEPFHGDVVNSYNDGPPSPGAKPLGPFYELESSSPAAALKPGETLTHISRTFHFQGPESELNALCKKTLGVSLKQIATAFDKP